MPVRFVALFVAVVWCAAAVGCASSSPPVRPAERARADNVETADTLQIYVADSGKHRLVRISDMTGAGWTTLGGPVPGNGQRQFNAPDGVFAVASPGLPGPRKIYVADKLNSRLVQMDDISGANWRARWLSGRRPLRVVANGLGGGLFVTSDPNTLQRFADINDGQPLTLMGTDIRTPPTPSGVAWAAGGGGLAFDRRGNILLATAKWAVKFGGWTSSDQNVYGDACCADGLGNSALSQPHGIAVDRAGRIYVADTFNHRVVRVSNMFGDGFTVLGGIGAGSGDNQFNQPTAVNVHDGKLYIVDSANNRIVRIDDMIDRGGVSTSVGWVALYGVPCPPRPLPPGTLPAPGDDLSSRYWNRQLCDGFDRPQDISVVRL